MGVTFLGPNYDFSTIRGPNHPKCKNLIIDVSQEQEQLLLSNNDYREIPEIAELVKSRFNKDDHSYLGGSQYTVCPLDMGIAD